MFIVVASERMRERETGEIFHSLLNECKPSVTDREGRRERVKNNAFLNFPSLSPSLSLSFFPFSVVKAPFDSRTTLLRAKNEILIFTRVFRANGTLGKGARVNC